MFEDLLNAFQNFRLNKTRAILSLLGVIIGVAAVIIITTLGQSATQNIAASWGNAGLDLITVSSGQVVRRSRGSIPLYLNESFREELWDTTRDLKTIFYQNSISATLRYGVTEVSATTTAVENGYLQTVGGELAQGEWFS
ncbi:MAG: ABC transporter permease, partial [Spirochaetales bacterium]